MVEVELTPGQHTIDMSLAGYAILETVIDVSSAGIVTCVSVTNGSCNSSTAPGITISSILGGFEVIGFLKVGAPISNICTWIDSKGGVNNLITYDIMALIRGYSGQENIGFSVLATHIMGAIAYYSGNITSGNNLTGCS